MTGWEMISCQRGHDSHETREIVVSIGGPTKYHDLPSIPRRFADTFEMEVWDTAIYPVDYGPWCPAHDAVSETLISHGVWEPSETILMLEAFRYCDSFIDIGAQLGWYSILAARAGLDVRGVEADADVAEVYARNALRNGLGSEFFDVHVDRVDPNSPISDWWFNLDHLEGRIAVKIDIEGAESTAVWRLAPIMDRVDFMLIEISPCFNDTYPELVRNIMDRGFRAFKAPTKSMPPPRLEIFPEDINEHELEGHVEALVKTWHQENVLFVRDGVW